MEPEIKNFAEIERFIKERPKEADALVLEWQKFIATNARENPELVSIKSREEFLAWVAQHTEKRIDTNIWVGKEITDAYFYLKSAQRALGEEVSGIKREEKKKERSRETTREALEEYIKEEKKYKQPAQPRPREFFRNVRTRISNIGRESYRVGKRLATQEGRTIGRFAGRTGLNIARQGTRLTIQGGRAALVGIRTTIQAAMALGRVVVAGIAAIGPVGWIVIAVIVVIIVIVFFLIMLLGGGASCASSLHTRVFVTSTKSNGDLVTYVKNNIDGTFTGDGLQAGDKICQWRADNATPNPLGGAWTAWLSTDAVDGKDRIVDQTYVRTECDKVVVVDSKADLINGDIDRPIAKDENSNTLKDVGVWTGTKENGQRITNDNCSGWTVGNSSQRGKTGDSGSTTYIWTSFFSSTCDDLNNHLYCFEQGTISPTPTPS